MRINVYAEELTSETDLIIKPVIHRANFYAVRMFLKSPAELHHDPSDDDRSAITIWVPWTRGMGHDFAVVRNLLQELLRQLDRAERIEVHS
jgi:hypothetical protein